MDGKQGLYTEEKTVGGKLVGLSDNKSFPVSLDARKRDLINRQFI